MSKEKMKNYKQAYEIIRASKTAGETNAMARQRAGISEGTWRVWKKEKAGFVEMLEEAERTHNLSKVQEAKMALHRRAVGYDYTEVRTEYSIGEDGQPVITRQVKTVKHLPPDVQACKEELHNLAPEEWGNTPVDDGVTGVRVEVVTTTKQ